MIGACRSLAWLAGLSPDAVQWEDAGPSGRPVGHAGQAAGQPAAARAARDCQGRHQAAAGAHPGTPLSAHSGSHARACRPVCVTQLSHPSKPSLLVLILSAGVRAGRPPRWPYNGKPRLRLPPSCPGPLPAAALMLCCATALGVMDVSLSCRKPQQRSMSTHAA